LGLPIEVICERWIFGFFWLIKLKVGCWGGRVVTYLWGVTWFFWSMFCPRCRSIFFPSSRLHQVKSFPLNTFLMQFFRREVRILGKFMHKMGHHLFEIWERSLGVRWLHEFNLALTGKWWSRMLEERESLWYNILIDQYSEEGAYMS